MLFQVRPRWGGCLLASVAFFLAGGAAMPRSAQGNPPDAYLESVFRLFPYDVRGEFGFGMIQDPGGRRDVGQVPKFRVLLPKVIRDVFVLGEGRRVETGPATDPSHLVAVLADGGGLGRDPDSDFFRGQRLAHDASGVSYLDYLNPTIENVLLTDLLSHPGTVREPRSKKGDDGGLYRITNDELLRGYVDVHFDLQHSSLVREATHYRGAAKPLFTLIVDQFVEVGENVWAPSHGLRATYKSGAAGKMQLGKGFEFRMDPAQSSFATEVPIDLFDLTDHPGESIENFHGWTVASEDSQALEIMAKSEAIHRNARGPSGGSASRLWLPVIVALVILSIVFISRMKKERVSSPTSG